MRLRTNLYVRRALEDDKINKDIEITGELKKESIFRTESILEAIVQERKQTTD